MKNKSNLFKCFEIYTVLSLSIVILMCTEYRNFLFQSNLIVINQPLALF